MNETMTTNKCVVKDVESSYLLYWVRVTSHRVHVTARARDKTSHTDESTLDDTTFDEFVNTQYSTSLTISNAMLFRHWSLPMKPAPLRSQSHAPCFIEPVETLSIFFPQVLSR